MRTGIKVGLILRVAKGTTTKFIQHALQETSTIPNELLMVINTTKAQLKAHNSGAVGIVSDIMKAWCEIVFKVPMNRLEVLDECLWFNSYVMCQGKALYYPNLHKQDIVFFKDFVDLKTNKIYSWAQFTHKHPGLITFLDYHKIKQDY